MLHSKFGTRKKPPGWLGQCVEFYDNVNILKHAKWFPHMSIGHDAVLCTAPDNADHVSRNFKGRFVSKDINGNYKRIPDIGHSRYIAAHHLSVFLIWEVVCSWYLIRRLHQRFKHAVQASWTCLLHDLGLDCTTCGIEHVLLYFRNQGFSNFDVYFNLA